MVIGCCAAEVLLWGVSGDQVQCLGSLHPCAVDAMGGYLLQTVDSSVFKLFCADYSGYVLGSRRM